MPPVDGARGPSDSCVQAHAQQLLNNRLLVLQERIAGLRVESELSTEIDRLGLAERAYEQSFNLGERAAAWSGIGGLFGSRAAATYDALVAPRQKRVRDLTAELTRREATIAVVEGVNRDLVARGPQPTGECTPVAPSPELDRGTAPTPRNPREVRI